MTTNGSVPTDVRYVLTEAGRNALAMAVECECKIRLIGVLLSCDECGTVYGSLKDQRLPAFKRMRTR